MSDEMEAETTTHPWFSLDDAIDIEKDDPAFANKKPIILRG